MKKLSLLVLVAVLLSSGSLFAKDYDKNNPTKSLKDQIWKILSDNNLEVDHYDVTAKILFTLNDSGEIEVISVDTKNADLEIFVKGKLNHRKVEVQEIVEGKVYKLPLRVTA